MKGKLMRIITVIKNWFLGNRTLSLFLFAIIGVILAYITYDNDCSKIIDAAAIKKFGMDNIYPYTNGNGSINYIAEGVNYMDGAEGAYSYTFIAHSNTIIPHSKFNKFFCNLKEGQHPRLFTSLILLLLALPTTFLLWVFRTHDVAKQIEEAKINNQNNSFYNALKLFNEKDNLEVNAVGLKLLMEIRQQGIYVEQIDLITQYKDFAAKEKNDNERN